MNEEFRPPLNIYVAWHPDSEMASEIASDIYKNYRRDHYKNLSGGAGINVFFRSIPAIGEGLPLDVALDESQATAVIILLDKNWLEPQWKSWLEKNLEIIEEYGLVSRALPVALDEQAEELEIREQMIRWDRWSEPENEKIIKVLSRLNYQICRMLRLNLEHLKRPNIDEVCSLENYLKKVQIFLSHSKHDEHGEKIARKIRSYIHSGDDLDSFFDIHDIPAGLRFDTVILHKIKVSAVLALHTDSYSSREWCRREIIEAKKHSSPLIVANCLEKQDERGFPYLGNVPIVRLDPKNDMDFSLLIKILLDEVLKQFLWQCKLQELDTSDRDTYFLPRTPELITLSAIHLTPTNKTRIIYPDPPIGQEERSLFSSITPSLELLTLNEWLSERQ